VRPVAILLLALVVSPQPGARAQGRPQAPSAAATPTPAEAPTLPSSAGQVRIEATTDRKAVTIGDPITVTVRLIHPKESRVEAFDPEGALSDLVILGRRTEEPKTLADGKVMETRIVRVARYQMGEFKIPSFEATVVEGPGSEVKVGTPPMNLSVGSILTEGDTRPADIKNPAVMPLRLLWPWLLGAALVAAGGVAWWLWRRHRARLKPQVVAAPPAPARPAHEVAYAELERLLSSGLLEKGKVKEFYIELAEILKRYFESLFGVDTFERTTSEILEALRLARLPSKGMALTSEFFAACDLVKFARHLPSADETRATVERAYRLVDELRPRETIAAAGGGRG
jgi:hypothetical protein